MKNSLYGLQFDFEGGTSTTLSAHIDPLAGQQIIAYQLRMLQENRIPRLLPLSAEDVNGALCLRYDISTKRRMTQLLRVQPPDMKLALETAYLLVQTLTDCSAYMLSENHFALQEDLVFASGELPNIQLCYLPLDGIQKKPVTDELRCLLLRLFSAVEGEQSHVVAPVLSVLGEDQYSLKSLKQQLKRLWLSGDEQASGDHNQSISREGEKLNPKGKENAKVKEKRKENVNDDSPLHKARRWWGAWFSTAPAKLNDSHTTKRSPPVQLKSAGKTEYLSSRTMTEEPQIVLSVVREGSEERFPMTEARWMIGRSETGTQYTDLSEGVSRVHCEISKSDNVGSLEVKDLGSLNGSYLNGERMIPYKAYPFSPSDVLRYARTELRALVERQSWQLARQESTDYD
jgi:pSer/pThr/pTyr-binding forkhead associated (FHA) protein